MIVHNYDADLEVSDTCVRSSLLSWVEYIPAIYGKLYYKLITCPQVTVRVGFSAICPVNQTTIIIRAVQHTVPIRNLFMQFGKLHPSTVHNFSSANWTNEPARESVSVSGIYWGLTDLCKLQPFGFLPFPNIILLSANKEICRNVNMIYGA